MKFPYIRSLLFIGLLVIVSCDSLGQRTNPSDPNGNAYVATSSLSSGSSSSTGTTSSSVESSMAGSSSNQSSVLQSSSSSMGISYGSVLDIRDSQSYKTITIGNQTWMAQNLNFGVMVVDSVNQSNLSPQKYCYGDSTGNCAIYGGLYQWAEAMGLPNTCNNTSCSDSIKTIHRGLCLAGWHIPSATDWDTLTNRLGGVSSAGSNMKDAASRFINWNTNASTSGNPSGFSALPAGLRFESGGFGDLGGSALFWEATENSATEGRDRNLELSSPKLFTSSDLKTTGFSLRCVMDPH